MYVDCRHCPLRRTSAFRPLEGDELDFVRSIKFEQSSFPARMDIVSAGDARPMLFTLFSGWAFRYMMLDGRARQIMDVLLPGDLVGLQSPITGRIRHSVRSITPVSLCLLDGEGFRELFDRYAELSEALVATLLYEEHRADTRLLLLGRLRPTQRLAYLFLELFDRLDRRGHAEPDSCELPLTYEHLADLVGVSRSQVGASLLDLKQRGWATLADGRLTIADRAQMSSSCRYQPLPDPAIRALI